MLVIQIFEGQERAFKRPVLRMRVEPHCLGAFDWQPDMITKLMTRDAFARELSEAGVALRRHLNRGGLLGFLLRLIGLLWFFRVVRFVLILLIVTAFVVGMIVLVQEWGHAIFLRGCTKCAGRQIV